MIDREIEQLATDVLAAMEVRSPPVNPFEIARAEGIRLLPGVYDDCFDGRIEYRHKGGTGRFYLLYPEPRPLGRVRFSIAHELGHYFLPHHRAYLLAGGKHASHADFVSNKQREREADRFAAALLLPAELFTAQVERKSGGFCNLNDLLGLAQRFQTSATSTAIRYVELDYEPCCVILSQGGKVLFARPSGEMVGAGLSGIRPNSGVPATSVTASLSRSRPNEAVARVHEGRIDAHVWFDRGPPRPLWEEAFLLGATGLMLSFLAFEGVDVDD